MLFHTPLWTLLGKLAEPLNFSEMECDSLTQNASGGSECVNGTLALPFIKKNLWKYKIIARNWKQISIYFFTISHGQWHSTTLHRFMKGNSTCTEGYIKTKLINDVSLFDC